MIVYVLTIDTAYEGETVYGVYSTEEVASAAAATIPTNSEQDPCVWPVELDAPPEQRL